MCAEIPYETLNTINNHHAVPGKYHYVKSVFFAKSQTAVTPKVFETFVAVSKKSEIKYTIFHEYYSGNTISGRSSDATAYFHREKTGLFLALATWESESPENEKIAIENCTAFAKLVVGAENAPLNVGYGNYSKTICPETKL